MERIEYEKAFVFAQEEIKKSLKASPILIREYLSHLANSQGKLLRAQCALVAACDDEGMVAKDAVYVAVAIELVHLASLVHDDIIDDAPLRRGQETLQKKFGKRTAVICGDYILSLALNKLSSIGLTNEILNKKMPNYIGRLCLGELYQHINNRNFNLSKRMYLKVISGKTAALFEAAFYFGALVNEKSEDILKRYKKIAHYMGMMFQLSDDCIDFESSQTEAEKPILADLENGVITWPVIEAFRENPKLKEDVEKGKATTGQLIKGVLKSSGLLSTYKLIDLYYSKAQKQLKLLSFEEGFQDDGRKMSAIDALIEKAGRRRK